MIDPVVVNFEPPHTPFRFPKLPHFTEKGSKIITASAAVVICVTMVSFVAYSFITTSPSFKKAHHLDTQSTPAQTNTIVPSKAAQPGGNVAVGTGGTTGNNSPIVTLTALPSSVTTGKKSHLRWSATNNPTSCTASDDWNGAKDASGEQDTLPLTKVQSYLFTITCKNATGTGFSTVSVGATAQSSTGTASRPTVTLAANPSAIYTGDKSTLIWNATNSPTSCTASGSWTGTKVGSGSENTPVLTTAKNYTYTITCVNSGGSGTATATVLANNPPANLPNVNISSNALGSITPGSSVILSWDVSNNPTNCTASGDWSGIKPALGAQTVGPLNAIRTYTYKLTCSNSAGSAFDTLPIQVLPVAPSVSLTLSPSSITAGSSSTITWSATNSPTSCTASGSWTGTKAASGTASTGALNTIKTYTYSLSCTNAGGTGSANNVALQVTAVPPPPPPVVSVSVNPISVTAGSSSTITWSATNSPSSCTASGDWTGTKAASGTASTGALNTIKTYTYSLSCTNAGGTGSASTGVTVSSGQTGSKPTVTLAVSPTSIGTGSSSTISWSVANSPTSCTASGSWTGTKAASGSASTGVIATPGTYSYTLTCSNALGSGTATASLTAIATPGITISVSPSTITAGGSATLSWSVTNSPSSCTAGGGWSGTKAASGTQTLSPAAGSYSYTLSCTNTGGTTSGSTSLTVNPAVVVYCAGRTPCIGVGELANHAGVGNCWGYNVDWVIDISTYAPNHKGGTRTGSLATPGSTCNSNIHAILAGSASIPNYTDSGGSTKHTHTSTTVNNGSGNLLASYFKGYYDATKP